MNDLVRSSRQSFLGKDSDDVLRRSTVAVVGVSGGGSHVAQQLAHVGFGQVHLIDPDITEEHHRHRLIGVSSAAVRRAWKKTRVLRRLMQHVHPEGVVFSHPEKWQDVRTVLLTCDIVITCLDGYSARDEIERFLRRHQVPMLDVGMDVQTVDGGHRIVGQVILSMPGRHCMRCFGFIREELLAAEAPRYGDAGGAPQVVWPNGTLASTAVGMAVGLLLPWYDQQALCPYLVYDGNRFELAPSPRLLHLRNVTCTHFRPDTIPGDLFV